MRQHPTVLCLLFSQSRGDLMGFFIIDSKQPIHFFVVS